MTPRERAAGDELRRHAVHSLTCAMRFPDETEERDLIRACRCGRNRAVGEWDVLVGRLDSPEALAVLGR